MNPEQQPSREEIEVKLTALLLGELPDDEAKLLRWAMLQDAELKRLHDRLKLTIGLVREVAKTPAAVSGEKTVPLTLSPERRRILRAYFQTPRPKEPLFWLKRINIPKVPRLVELLVVVGIVAILAAMMLPALSKAKNRAQSVTIINNLRILDAAKQQWALEQNKPADAAPTMEDLKPYLGRGSADLPAVAGEKYILGKVSESPVADFDASQARQLKGAFAKKLTTGPDHHRQLSLDSYYSGGTITVATPAPSSPAAVAVAPSPLLASAPVNIVLPTTESASQVATLDGPLNKRAITGSLHGYYNDDGAVANEMPPTPPQGVAESAMPIPASGLAMSEGEIGGAVMEAVPPMGNDKIAANTLLQDGKWLFENGKLEEASAKFGQAQQADPNNSATAYYRHLVEQAKDAREAGQHTIDTQVRMAAVEKQWVLPSNRNQPSSATVRPTSVTNGTLNYAFAINGPVQKEPDRSGLMADSFSSGTGGAGGGGAGTSRLGAEKQQANANPNVISMTVNQVVLSPARTDLAKDSEKKESAQADEPVDAPIRKPAPNAPVPQPEILTRDNAFSTFSLNVSDVSFKLAAASLVQGQMPDAAGIRSEEFINAFDYRDPDAAAGQPLAFAAERARYPFVQNRDLLRFSIKTAAAGRPAGRALNLVLLLDNSGSMERADRVQIIREALRVLTTQLQPQDTVSVVTFARTARLWLDGVSGADAGAALEKIGELTPQGGTNLEEAMRLAYETARRHYLASGLNRVVMLTDGAANLGNVDATVLKEKVEANRKQGIALDCFGIGWEGLNDDLLEQLARNGDGRYAFINTPEDAAKEFAAKLAGALQIAASDVKVQVEFNPQRVVSYRQIGYAKHQLTKEQFRDNTVDAAEIAAQEAGNALYTIETKPDGTGPVATVRVRYKVPGTAEYRERSWDVPYTGNAVALDQASPAMRLAATASAFSEWLAASPFAQEVTLVELIKTMSGVPEIYGADERPKRLVLMLMQAKSLAGK